MNAPFAPYRPTQAIARSAYAPSRRSNPFALAISTAIVGGLVSSFVLTNVVMVHKVKRQPLVINLMKMPEPPPQREDAPAEQHEQAQVQPTVAAPSPEVAVAAPEAPPIPTAPVLPIQSQPAPPSAAPAPAAASAGPREGGDISGNLLLAAPPSYPLESRRLREQGTVVLSVLVSIAGRVEDISVARSSGFFRLDHAALKAVRHWRWSPFQQQGEQVAVRGHVTIPFVLTT